MVRLTALICVNNQDARLSECLRRLSFCDEIVVVADRCTDRSQDIARRHGAVVIDGIFPLENQRKTAGHQATTGEWILELEADEVVDAALAWEIRAVLQRRPQGDWFEIPIDNYVGETLVRDGWSGGLSARRAPRLYRRGMKVWSPLRTDAAAAMAGQPAGALTGAIRRNLGADAGALVERLNRLTALRAEDLADTGRPGSLAGGLARGLAAFLGGFLGRGGWREGRMGLLVALLSGLEPVLTRLKARDVLEARQAAAAEATRPTRAPQVVGLAAR